MPTLSRRRPARFLIGLLIALVPSLALAESRVALILGDGKYLNAPDPASLRNKPRVTDALSAAGYKAIEAGIISKDGMQWAVDVLVRQLKKHGPDSVGFVYFTGYSVAVKGQTYLIPAKSKIESDADVIAEGYPLSTIFSALALTGNSSNAVVLDTCNGNPFYSGGSRAAFAGTAPPPGILLSTCAAPGTAVSAGTSDAGAFSGELAEAMAIPGISLQELFTVTRWSVAKNTQSDDLPWTSSSLAEDVPFGTGGPSARDPSLDPILAESALFDSVTRSGGKSDYGPYLSQYPAGAFARFTNIAVIPKAAPGAASLDDLLWSGIKTADNPALFKEYLARFPDGNHVTAAKERIAALEASVKTPEAGTAIAAAPVSARKFAAAMTGTGEAGWANLYLEICGPNIRYRASITEQAGAWTAELVNLKNNEVVEFRQADTARRAGQILLYGRYGLEGSTKNKVILQINPEANGRVKLNIPNVGVCATGQLN